MPYQRYRLAGAAVLALGLGCPGAAPVRAESAPVGAVPLQVLPGYRAVWEDDRLNPLRGRRTDWGDAQMRTVWTERVPQRLVDPALRPPQAVAPVAVPPSAGSRYIQVGAFTEADAAGDAVADLHRLGLPARQGRVMADGELVTVIFAGPFADRESHGRAQSVLRRAGYTPVSPAR
ncbi:SPOR domain-containing protein [Rhodovulum visakhapatnamense]|uniref:Sporulation related protein n=1 Tax=Rhodovulum visakhapatnamense TaxID=364297 RepID=A0A4R8FUA3_9RHOB|nr:SPOR domain-containing protein [Rhodovulum visakhapatnamense]TDX27057.1 sporulation related protein [Rhodovulum visakhapatnamense]